MREELAMFEQMLISEERHTQTLAIYRFKVEPDVLPGEYRYRLLLLTPTDRRGRDFNGRLELVVSLQEGGQNAMMSFPEPGDAAAAAIPVGIQVLPAGRRDLPGEPEGEGGERAGAGLRDRLEPAARDALA